MGRVSKVRGCDSGRALNLNPEPCFIISTSTPNLALTVNPEFEIWFGASGKPQTLQPTPERLALHDYSPPQGVELCRNL